MSTSTQLRSDVAEVVAEAEADLRALWREIADAAAAQEALADVLPEVVRTYGAMAAVVGADWYDDLREEREIPGRFRATPVNLGASGAEALAGWSASPLYQAEPDWDAALVRLTGGTQRRIANFARVTVMRSSVRDPRSRGWQRVGSPQCDFCRMLIGRGAVYRTETTAGFDAHDHCNCAAEPAWR